MSSVISPEAHIAMMQATQGSPSVAGKKVSDAAKQARNMEKIEQAAQEFEALFISEMMKPMFEGIEVEAPYGGGKGEEVFTGFLLQEYGKLMSQTGSIGMADHVRKAMIMMQEQASGKTDTALETADASIEMPVTE
jgi:Rod binding domain-containing protein